MAKDSSFDVVSNVDMQEVDNAINQVRKEISQRYDFKNSNVEVKVEENELKLLADSDFMLTSVIDIIQSKMLKRKVSIQNLEYGKVETASGGLVRQIIKIKQGIDQSVSKVIVKDIKDNKIKVQAQINGDTLRVTGKNKDDLQATIQLLKSKDYGIELQFNNYR